MTNSSIKLFRSLGDIPSTTDLFLVKWSSLKISLKKSARECGSSIGRDIKEGSATIVCLIWIISAMPAKMENASLLRKKDVSKEIEEL